MKTLIVICYILAGLLGILALILLAQMLGARQTIQNATIGFQLMLGPMFDPLLDTLTRSVQSLLCVSSGVFFAGGGIIFAMGRLLRRLSQQNLRILELEAQLRASAGDTARIPEPDNSSLGLT